MFYCSHKMRLFCWLIIFFGSSQWGCRFKNPVSMSSENAPSAQNPLMCDPDSGFCAMPGDVETTATASPHTAARPIKVVYYTDPICSSCWGVEPALRKLKLEYGDVIEIEYRMGGLLPDWSYNSGGISKPSDVARHWDEVSIYYDMPIDGDVWLEDPLDSSYPPSIAFKAAQMQDEKMALVFLRRIREMVFLEKKNITIWKHLESAAREAGLSMERFKADYHDGAKGAFEDDLKWSKTLGIRGFPTLIFMDTTGHQEVVYGARPYEVFEKAVHQLLPTVNKKSYDRSWQSLFAIYPTMTANEWATLSGMKRDEAEQMLVELTKSGELREFPTKNGSLWRRAAR